MTSMQNIKTKKTVEKKITFNPKDFRIENDLDFDFGYTSTSKINFDELVENFGKPLYVGTKDSKTSLDKRRYEYRFEYLPNPKVVFAIYDYYTGKNIIDSTDDIGIELGKYKFSPVKTTQWLLGCNRSDRKAIKSFKDYINSLHMKPLKRKRKVKIEDTDDLESTVEKPAEKKSKSLEVENDSDSDSELDYSTMNKVSTEIPSTFTKKELEELNLDLDLEPDSDENDIEKEISKAVIFLQDLLVYRKDTNVPLETEDYEELVSDFKGSTVGNFMAHVTEYANVYKTSRDQKIDKFMNAKLITNMFNSLV